LNSFSICSVVLPLLDHLGNLVSHFEYVDGEVPGAVASPFRRDLKGETAEVNEKIQPNGPRKMLALNGVE